MTPEPSKGSSFQDDLGIQGPSSLEPMKCWQKCIFLKNVPIIHIKQIIHQNNLPRKSLFSFQKTDMFKSILKLQQPGLHCPKMIPQTHYHDFFLILRAIQLSTFILFNTKYVQKCLHSILSQPLTIQKKMPLQVL